MSNITYRLVKGQELTFAEIDENFSSLDSDIRGNRRYFDSTLEQFGLGRDSDFLAILAQRDSDAAIIILSGLANHDSDITNQNDRCDSEHAWNLIEHKELADSIGREHAFNVAEHDILQYNINQISGNLESGSDSEHAWNVSEHSIINGRVDAEEQARILNDVLLGNALDSEHNWNLAEHNSIINQIGAKLDSEHSWNVAENNSLQSEINSLEYWVTSSYTYLENSLTTLEGTVNDNTSNITNLENSLTTLEGTVNANVLTAGSGVAISAGNVISNTAPDQTVAITGSGTTTVTGTYPNFTVTSTDTNVNTTYTAGSGLTLSGTQFINAAPDQTVSIAGTGATSVTGTYPNFTVSSTDNNTTYTAGTGLSLSGTQFTNTAPDKTVAITGAGATSVTGTYPNFTVSSTDNNTTYTAGTGMTLSGTQFINAAPDRTVSITGSGSTTVTGTYPNFTVSSTSGSTYTGGNGITVSGSSIAMSGSYTGTFTATGDVVAFSDMTLKSEVTAIDEALEKLMMITGYTYNTKGSTRRHSGVMAQDVEEVLPEVVHTSEDGTKGVAYGNMMGLVIEAIRELKTQVDELKGK